MRTPDYPSGDAQGWANVDAYLAGLFAQNDEVLESVLAQNAQSSLPPHDVSPLQGQFLALLIKMTGARRVLEIGTLGGYSTIWMARALSEGGQLITIEFSEHHADVARANIALSGLSERVDLHVGAALDVLPTLEGPFEVIFIDADKPNNPYYLEWALKLAHAGTVIVGDNVVRGGAVVDGESPDGSVQGVRSYLAAMSANPNLRCTAIQTVGEKGWDGFAIAIVQPVESL